MEDDNETKKINTQLLSSMIFKAMKSEDINLIVEIDQDVNIDEYTSHLMQIIYNIFQNSIDAFYEKSIDNKYIFVNTYKNGNILTISIKDNAGGIEEENISRIFEPYFTTKHQSQGKGLGLDLVYRFIKYMGGAIEAKNIQYEYNDKEYKGLELIITLVMDD
ncbi:MAG: HAMP domain-containing sensor histidine kinase [Campylobacterota bacterium]|nr:HAMP domain-containing sensor histidine kinase [Campylobacterota bacterium]